MLKLIFCCLSAAMVRKEIQDETDRVTGKSKMISPVPIHLSIYSPNGVLLLLLLIYLFSKVLNKVPENPCHPSSKRWNCESHVAFHITLLFMSVHPLHVKMIFLLFMSVHPLHVKMILRSVILMSMLTCIPRNNTISQIIFLGHSNFQDIYILKYYWWKLYL